MPTETITREITDFVSDVRCLIQTRIEKVAFDVGAEDSEGQLMSGKMLRTKLASHLSCSGRMPADCRSIELACAATEIAHTASLIHDDLIDGGCIRRNLPTLWKSKGASAAVLIGDCLLCESMDILFDIEDGRYVKPFVMKLREACTAEAEQELLRRGECLNEAESLRIARGKTGPFFAFVGQVCGGEDEDLSLALEKAGYHVGTAYQIADDLIDIVGLDEIAGKTLGTDLSRGKFTIPMDNENVTTLVLERIFELSESALDCLNNWPRAREALADFFAIDLQPVLDKQTANSVLSMRLAQ